MQFDLVTLGYTPEQIPALAQAAETLGFDGFWVGETNSDPFIALTLAAEHTHSITLGTAIAVTFPRSPTTLAHLGHDLARLSVGRFALGLGPQVRAHNERRFGVKWEKPVQRMREYVQAIRAVWDSWQNGTRLHFRGELFRLDLMPPFFSPPPHAYGKTPIYLAAVNPQMLNVAGEVSDGVFLHALHTVKYIREAALPSIENGLQKANRMRSDVSVSTAVFAIPIDDPAFAERAETYVRTQIAFYMSTPAYRVVTDLHGWGDVQYRLSRYARTGAWDEMAKTLPDEVMAEMTVRGPWAELPGMIRAKYGGLIDRVSYYLPFVPGEADDGWRASIKGFRALSD